MKVKTANRWLVRNKWKIARLAKERPGTQFHKQLLRCRRASDSILFRKFESLT